MSANVLRSLLQVRTLLSLAMVLSVMVAPVRAADEPAGTNERLMITELQDNELAVIDFFSVTGTRTIGRTYFVRGGETKVMTAHRNIIEIRNRVPHVVNKYLLGDLALSADEVLGLESLLVFYSARIPGNCATRDTIQVEFYRDGKRIGQFKFQDDTCFTTEKDADATRVKTHGKVNDVIMDSLIPLREFDSRIRAASTARD